MTVTQEGINLIKSFEGLKLKAYLDSVGVPTIGYGTTKYPDGKDVKPGDHITEDQANEYIQSDINYFSSRIRKLVTSDINDNQFSALVSFAYNLGEGALKTSTLLKRVNLNPNDPKIVDEFAKWVYAGGNKLEGLVKRRKAESDLYFKD